MKAKIKVWEDSYAVLYSAGIKRSKVYYWSVKVPRAYRVAWIRTSGQRTSFELALDSARVCIARLKEEYEDKTPKVYKESVEL